MVVDRTPQETQSPPTTSRWRILARSLFLLLLMETSEFFALVCLVIGSKVHVLCYVMTKVFSTGRNKVAKVVNSDSSVPTDFLP